MRTFKRSYWSLPYFIFMLMFVVLPLVMIAIYAFTDANGAFTLGNFKRFFTTSEDIKTFAYSIEIAMINIVISSCR